MAWATFDVLTCSIDFSEVKAAWAAEVRTLQRGTADAVEVAAKQGKATGRVLAPARSYALRQSIEAQLLSSGPTGAEGEVVASAAHASFVADGTLPHIITPKRKKFLRFMGRGGLVFTKRVSHPGTNAHPYARRMEEVAEATLNSRCEDVVAGVCSRMSRG